MPASAIQILNSLQTERDIEVTPVYEKNRASRKRIVINVGGARSSKSYSIAQLMVERLTNEQNKKILISRKTFPALRLTAMQLVISLCKEYGFYAQLDHDKTTHVLSCPWTGSYIVFMSVDDPEKIKSSEWNYIWLEECNEFDWTDWLIMGTRLSGRTTLEEPNQIFLSLNPSDEAGWVNQKIILGPSFMGKIDVIHSTHKDNPFLDDAYRESLEDLRQQDADAARIYTDGLWGTLTHIIYPQYEIVPELPDFSTLDETIYGLDFGFNVPSGLIEIGLKDQTNAFLRQKLYQTKLINSSLVEKLKELIPPEHRNRPIYADCAEPDRIQEIFDEGFNIFPADKAVKPGIDFCKKFKFVSTAENVDLNKERGMYKWRTDKNGNILDEPVKFMDHLMDAKRYALFTHHKLMGALPNITVIG